MMDGGLEGVRGPEDAKGVESRDTTTELQPYSHFSYL
jgi:hypothetical protein